MAKSPTLIKSLARAHTESAIKVLSGIMNETTAPHAARVSAASALMDRGWGKPTQPIAGDDDGPIQIEMVRRIIVNSGNTDSGSLPPAAEPGPV